jgi:hypothetical protein
VEHAPRYAVWQERESSVCAPVEQRGTPARTDLEPRWVSEVALPPRPDEAGAIAAIFAFTGAPLRLYDLVEGVALLLNVCDQTSSASEIDIPADTLPMEERIGHRETLVRLWGEIAELPCPQRCALLLNLRDDGGGCALTSLPATGVASIREIARVMEIAAETLAEFWKRLPLNDLEIAGILDISRQQVINLRKSARERLNRRMAGNMRAKPGSSHGRGQNG